MKRKYVMSNPEAEIVRRIERGKQLGKKAIESGQALEALSLGRRKVKKALEILKEAEEEIKAVKD